MDLKNNDNFTCPLCATTLKLFKNLRQHLKQKHQDFIEFLQSKNEFENLSTFTIISQVLKKIKSDQFEELNREFKNKLLLSKKVLVSRHLAKRSE